MASPPIQIQLPFPSTATCSTPRLPSPSPSSTTLHASHSPTSLTSSPNSLSCIRTYENDAARLSISGPVNLQQAITAAASDGGTSADEHLNSGLSSMVVETVFPGRGDDHATVSTKLFLPASEVKEKARKLKSSLPKDVLARTDARDIVALTFRQVVVEQLWDFQLGVCMPGSRRNMDDLGSQREVAASFSISSSNEKALSGLGEAVCNLALNYTEEEFLRGTYGKSHGFYGWFSNPKRFISKDSSVIIYLFEDEIVENAMTLLEKFNTVKTKYMLNNKNVRRPTWESSVVGELRKIGGSEFCHWVSEYVPAYRIEIDAAKVNDLNLEGWKRTTEGRFEVFLTLSQMVGLANVLDMYFEDVYTHPSQQLSCNVERRPQKLPKQKGNSLVGFARPLIIAVTILVSIGVLVKLCAPSLYNSKYRKPQQLDVHCHSEEVQLLSVDPSMLEAYCSSVIRKVKDYYGWSEDIEFESSVGAWIGKHTDFLRQGYEADSSYPKIASYQVVLSTECNVVGFKPTNSLAVNHWSANPIAKELYGGKKLSPGLLEPALKVSKPDKVIVLELLMSLDKDNCFALVRQMQ